MNNRITTEEIVISVLEGSHDEDFKRIFDAIKARRKALAEGRTLLFKPRDRVRFNSRANPKYLVNIEGVVAKINQTTITVTLGPNAGRFANQDVRCHSSIIEKVT